MNVGHIKQRTKQQLIEQKKKIMNSFKIIVNGTGKFTALADNAVLTFVYESCDKDETVAINAVGAQFAKIKATKSAIDASNGATKLRDFGYKFSVVAQYTRPKDGEAKQFDKHRAAMTVSVDVEVGRASFIIGEMMSAGMTSWVSTDYYVATERSQQIAKIALQSAVAQAIDNAGVIAQAANATIGTFVHFTMRGGGSSVELYYDNKRTRSSRSYSMNESAFMSSDDDDNSAKKVKFPLIEPPLMEFIANVDGEVLATQQPHK